MSRAAAAQSSSTATSGTLLVLRDNPNGSSTALLRSEPFGSNGHPVEVGALVMLLGLSEYSDQERIKNRKEYLDCEQTKRKKRFRDYAAFTSHGGGIFKITSYLVWARALSFLLHDNAFQTVPLLISPIPSIDDQLNNLQSRALETVRLATPNLNANFFSKNNEAGFEFACLLDSALNADLKTVTDITTTMHPNKLRRLHGTGKAITCLGRITVERIGTPLQMAIYDHDEEMVAFFKEKMDPVEFQCQCEAVVGTDYDAFLRKQEAEATALCTGLEDAFNAARPNEFTVNNTYAVSTTSTQLPRTIDAFINKLMDYVKNNPVHNPTILQHVYEIYTRLPSDFNRDCYFSQKVIGGVQSFLSARWLHHFAQSIDDLAENNEAPRRSFICRDSSSHIDIRHLVATRLGVDSFLSIFGGRGRGGVACAFVSFRGSRKLCQTKTTSFQNLLRRECNRLVA